LRGAYQLANAATALAVVGLLQERLHVDAGAIRAGLCAVSLPGRFQVLPGRPAIVLDVAHNPHAARVLAATLGAMGYFPQTIAVFGMLADKDVAGVIAAVKGRFDRWFVASVPGPRGASAESMRAELERAAVASSTICTFANIEAAFAAAREEADEADRIVIFGSFLTVAAALAAATA
jgi:dihydrofolate synthase/folylpolyglutamate synthase